MVKEGFITGISSSSENVSLLDSSYFLGTKKYKFLDGDDEDLLNRNFFGEKKRFDHHSPVKMSLDRVKHNQGSPRIFHVD